MRRSESAQDQLTLSGRSPAVMGDDEQQIAQPVELIPAMPQCRPFLSNRRVNQQPSGHIVDYPCTPNSG
jgi:hypothetical protein